MIDYDLEKLDCNFIGKAFEFAGLIVQLIDENPNIKAIIITECVDIFNIYLEIGGEIFKYDDVQMHHYSEVFKEILNRIKDIKLNGEMLFLIGLILGKVKYYNVNGILDCGKSIDNNMQYLERLVIKNNKK